MNENDASRREFLRVSAAAAAACSLSARAFARQGSPPPRSPSLEKRAFGKTDMKVTVLGFGGAEIGYEKTSKETVQKLLNAALDAGLNVVDTAECYIDSEVQIAEAIGSRRKEYYLFTKCGHAVEEAGRDADWSKEGVLRSIERSLARLKTDAVDLLQLHSCSLDELKKGDCIEGLEAAKKQGKARFIGYSGDSKAARYAVECGRFDALQTSLNIVDQESIDLLLPLAREKKMGVVAKRPIANAVWRNDGEPSSGYHLEYWKRLRALEYPFATGDRRKDEGPNGPAGIALRFTAMQPGVDVLIVGTSKPERWKQNAALLEAGPLDKDLESSIRARWKAVAKDDWIGQT